MVTLLGMYKQLYIPYILHSAQCTVNSVHVNDDMIWPMWSAYGGGESGRETNVPLKHLNTEKNG